ncbi:glycosyltransferase family 2 protein [Candidatus Hakubella thermalkaliphila]|uniref:Glycosyltransferase 2-like domain-containing protein n=2 Tax=Candidatus Hakubella thermalkaliphila TaxID=2754717 RepID=A0A6V8Q7D8_9ACTN|nr:glycosyltransferase family 2 protein [Candidatus Hakubella thermalkaliphila]MBT9168639.1 hypothetical protein [Bacillota bacterium]GFP40473.1 hypothetical protein HKBW3S47_02170 [Candidatus Hakubella thermalkaliphila]
MPFSVEPEFLDSRSEICGFYDADSRPEPDVLLFIAHRWLESAGAVRIWQGSVFQVRNFFHLYPINKVVAIYQAVSHEWYLPVLMWWLPFVGGTNLFVQTTLLKEIGGYGPQSLTEDLELGVRAYVETGAWPEYFPYPSTEQTPATFRLYFWQRLRWATGHLQVTEKFRRAIYAEPDKIKKRDCMVRRLFVKGQLEWTLYQAVILVVVTYLPLGFAGYLDPDILPPEARWLMSLGLPFYFSFTLTRYMHFRPYIDFTVAPRNVFSRALAVCQLLDLPLAGIALSLPFSTAVLLKSLRRQSTVWIKTPRTKEEMNRPQRKAAAGVRSFPDKRRFSGARNFIGVRK